MVFWLENKMKQHHQVLSEIHLLAFGGNLCLRKQIAARDFESFQSWFLLPQCSSKNFGFAPFGPALPFCRFFSRAQLPFRLNPLKDLDIRGPSNGMSERLLRGTLQGTNISP